MAAGRDDAHATHSNSEGVVLWGEATRERGSEGLRAHGAGHECLGLHARLVEREERRGCRKERESEEREGVLKILVRV